MSEFQSMVVEVLTKLYKKYATKEVMDALEDGKWHELLWQQLTAHELHTIGRDGAGDFFDVCALHRVSGYFAAPIPIIEHTLACNVLTQVGASIHDGIYTITMNERVPWGRYAQYVVRVQKECLLIYEAANVPMQYEVNVAAEPRDIAHYADEACETYALTNTQYDTICAMLTMSDVAKMTGAVQRAVDLSVQFSREREQFGRPIHRFQLVQQHIAKLAGEEAILQAACAALHLHNLFAIGAARIRAEEAIQVVTTSAHQIHAAIGVTHEHTLHHATRRLWAWREEGLTAHVWKQHLAQTMLTNTHTLWEQLTFDE